MVSRFVVVFTGDFAGVFGAFLVPCDSGSLVNQGNQPQPSNMAKGCIGYPVVPFYTFLVGRVPLLKKILQKKKHKKQGTLMLSSQIWRT